MSSEPGAGHEAYLRQQWAGMMFSFLLGQNEEARVADTLTMLKGVSERVEMLSRQILESVGTTTAKLTAAMYDKMLGYECVRDMAYMGASPNPIQVLESANFQECFEKSGKMLTVQKHWEGSSVGSGGELSKVRFEKNSEEYAKLKAQLLKILEDNHLSLEAYLSSAKES